MKRLSVFLVVLGSIGMFVSMFLGTADALGTNILGMPVPGALEVTESTMVLIVFGALAYAQIQRAHIRVELLYGVVGPRLQVLMDAIGHAVALLFYALVAWVGLAEAMYSLEIGEATPGAVRFPLYPARWLLVIGTTLLLVQLSRDLISDLLRLWRGKPPSPASTEPGTTASSQNS